MITRYDVYRVTGSKSFWQPDEVTASFSFAFALSFLSDLSYCQQLFFEFNTSYHMASQELGGFVSLLPPDYLLSCQAYTPTHVMLYSYFNLPVGRHWYSWFRDRY